MAFSFIKWANGQSFSGTTVSATFGSAVSAGNTILVGYSLNPSTLTVSSISDGTNTYTIGSNTTGTSGGDRAGSCFALNIAAGTPTVTITASGTISGANIWIEEWSGIATTAAADGGSALFTGGSGTPGEAFNAGSFTPSTNGDLIWAFGNCGNGGALGLGSGFATAKNDSATSYLSEFQTQSTASAINAGFTSTPGGFSYYAVAAAFKAPAGGGQTQSFFQPWWYGNFNTELVSY